METKTISPRWNIAKNNVLKMMKIIIKDVCLVMDGVGSCRLRPSCPVLGQKACLAYEYDSSPVGEKSICIVEEATIVQKIRHYRSPCRE